MKTMVFLVLLSSIAFASDYSDLSQLVGKYEGINTYGNRCFLHIKATESKITWIKYSYTTSEDASCGFKPKRQSVANESIFVSGRDIEPTLAKCKAKLVRDIDGALVSADLGVGFLVQIGFDTTCGNLIRK